MVKVVDITEFSSLDEIQNINFKFQKDSTSKFNQIVTQNLISFDIETSNGYRNPSTGVVEPFIHNIAILNPDHYKHLEPVSLMYVWQCAVETFLSNDESTIVVFGGRTWESYEDFVDRLSAEVKIQAHFSKEDIALYGRESCLKDALKRKHTLRLFTYVHNFGFEFNHLRNIEDFNEQFAKVSRKGRGATFARTPRKPMKSVITKNKVKIEYRDSYILTQKSLAAWCDDEKLPVKKLDEDESFYMKIRTPESNIDDVIQYSINDVVCMIYGLEKYREKYGCIENIPLTQTGGIRRVCVENVTKQNAFWANLCTNVTTKYTLDLFRDLSAAFVGGWTHANAYFAGEIFHNIWHGDFASSYPTVMTTRTFPCYDFETYEGDDAYNEFMELDMHDLEDPELKYHYMITVRVKNFHTTRQNTFWSVSKCEYVKYPANADDPVTIITDNGKIEWCEEAVITMTDLDWYIFRQAYSIEEFDVIRLSKAMCDYLPIEMIKTILDYYGYKTSLKMDEDDPDWSPSIDSQYVESKQFINGIYGCSVTKVVSDDVLMTEDGWVKIPLTEEAFNKKVWSTKEESTFLSYQIGVWVTAWARYNLWSLILQFDKGITGSYVLYGDTDSLFLRDGCNLSIVKKYNEKVEYLERDVAARLGFDEELYVPKTKKGVPKRLGLFAAEDDCGWNFKTLGAKRYCTEKDGVVKCTIAGLPKESGPNKIKTLDDFNNNTRWNTKESGKKTAIYCDNMQHSIWIDEEGNRYESDAKYGVVIEPTTFDLSMTGEYLALIDYINNNGDIPFEDDRFSDVSELFRTK